MTSAPDQNNDQNLRNLGRLFFVAFWGFVFLVILVAKGSFADYIKSRIDQKWLFNARELMFPHNVQPQNLKILVQDDATISYLNGNPMSLVDLSFLLENIAKRNPRVILIDQMFKENPYPTFNEPNYHVQVANAIERIKSIKTPVFTGADFDISPRQKQVLDLSSASYDIKTVFGNASENTIDLLRKFVSRELSQSGVAYGYNHNLKGAFAGTGHIRYSKNGVSSIAPLMMMPEGRILPHLAFRAATSLQLTESGLAVEGSHLPLDSNGYIPIPHKPRSFFNQVWSLAAPLGRAKNGIPETKVDPGDIVLIIPPYYTGNADIHEGGPFGEMPGGLLVASVLSALLTGDWIGLFEFDRTLVIIVLMLGGLLGHKSRPLLFWLWLTISIAAYSGFALLWFCHANHEWPVFMPMLAFAGASLILYAGNILRGELRRMQLQRDFYREKSLRILEESERKVLTERLSLGKAVQEMLLPQNLKGNIATFDYHMRYLPAQQMSGDWLYYWDLGDDERRIFIGDVVGKGPSAALPVAVIITTIKEAESRALSVEETLQLINQRLVEQFRGKVTTTFAGVIMHKDQRLTFLNAGSPGWFLVNPDSHVEYVLLRSNPLGLNATIEIASRDFVIEDGALFFTFTDGYLEGARAYKKLTRELHQFSFETISHDLIHDTLMQVGEGHRLSDDMTMVSIHAVSKKSA